jgi:tetratricopeptide (TPR) repeat protein
VLFSRQKKFPRAIADLNQAIALKPNQYQAYANMAKVYQQQKQVASAVKQMDSAIKTASTLVKAGQLERPLLAHLYRNRAFLQMDRKESLAALEDLRQAIQVDPQANDHVECGRILHGLQRFQEALIAHDAALKVDSDHADAHLGRAETLFKLDNCKEAIASLDRYLKKPNPAAGPNVRADVYRARGLAGVKLGHYADARDDFTLALSLKEDSATHAYRGWAYLVSKAPQLALLDFEKALQLDENNADAYIGRASARVKLGAKLSDLQEAVADAEKALSCGKRNDSRMMWNAARIYAQAAAKLDGERDRHMLKVGARYREQALQLLREALNVTPVAERASFMRKYIQGDADLSRFSRLLSSG